MLSVVRLMCVVRSALATISKNCHATYARANTHAYTHYTRTRPRVLAGRADRTFVPHSAHVDADIMLTVVACTLLPTQSAFVLFGPISLALILQVRAHAQCRVMPSIV